MKKVISILILLSIVLGFSAFQCSSTELTSAKLYIQQENYEKALESLKKEVATNPKSDEGFYLLGTVLGEQGDIKGMLENFDKSLAISNKFEQNITQSKKYYWADSFNKGVMLFNKASKLGGSDSANVVFEQAISSFKKSIQCQPDSSDSYKNLAFAYLNMGRNDEAIEPFQKVKDLTKSEASYVQLGDIYIQKGFKEKESGKKDASLISFDNAIKVLKEGKEKYPSSGDILLLLSNAYIASDQLDVAKDAFKEGVAKDPENKFYRYNYGSLLLNANEFAEAEVQLKKALEIDPDYENAVYNLAVNYVKWGATIREKEEANAKSPDDVSDAYKEKFKLALPLLEKYSQIKPEEGFIWDLLGKVYVNLGMQDKSEEAYKKADMYK